MRQDRTSASKILFSLLLIIFLWIGVTRFGETKRIFDVLTTGKWYWIGAALACQIFFYPIYIHFVQAVFSILHLKVRKREILPVYIASKFTDVALPIASVGKIAIFVRNAQRYGISSLDMSLGMLLVSFGEVIGFTIVAFASLAILFLFGKPLTFVMVSFLILLVIVIGVFLLLIRTAIFKKPLNRPMRWMIKIIARIAGRKNVDMEQIGKISLEVGARLRQGKKLIPNGLEWSVLIHLVNLLTFGLVYLAFAGGINILAILAGYTAGLLFTIVSVTPQGVGVAETVMISTLHAFGMDISTSAVITLAFRGLLYWLPLFPGFYFFSHLELRK